MQDSSTARNTWEARPSESSRTRGTRPNLKLHGVQVRDATAVKSDLLLTEAALAAMPRRGQLDFIDLPSLPELPPIALVLFEDEAGDKYYLDSQGDRPIARPLAASWRTKPDSSGPAVAASSGQGERGVEGAANSGPPSFLEQALSTAGTQLASQLASAMASGQPIGPLLGSALTPGGPGGLISAIGSAAISNLGNMLLGAALGKLFGSVDDSSSLGKQLAAKFAPQLLSSVQGTAAEYARSALGLPGAQNPDMAEQIRKFFLGVQSAASVPVGMADSPGGAGYVQLAKGKIAALKLGDVAQLADNIGPFVDGHPNIFFNGQMAVGEGQLAAGSKGPLGPLNVDSTVLMATPPPPPPPAKPQYQDAAKATNDANMQLGDKCDAKDGAIAGQLAANQEGDVARPLVCSDPDKDGVGVVARPDRWEPPEILKSLLGFENNPQQAANGDPIDNISALWGAIEIGSPREPKAGNASFWWIPDRIFKYNMSNYYLHHDVHFNTNRNLSQLGSVARVELESFLQGIAGSNDPGRLLLQILFSGATATVGGGSAAVNTLMSR